MYTTDTRPRWVGVGYWVGTGCWVDIVHVDPLRHEEVPVTVSLGYKEILVEPQVRKGSYPLTFNPEDPFQGIYWYCFKWFLGTLCLSCLVLSVKDVSDHLWYRVSFPGQMWTPTLTPETSPY